MLAHILAMFLDMFAQELRASALMTEVVKEDNSAKCAPMISLALVSTPVVMKRSRVYLL